MFDEKLYKSMELIGQILDKEERCSEVVNSLKEWQTDLSSRTSDIPEESKPRVFTGACSFKGGHGIEGTYRDKIIIVFLWRQESDREHFI